MNTTTLAPPQAMLERLRDAGANPAVTEVERNQAIDWLRCLLVDFTALNAHIALLQQLNGNALFCFPAPRRDGGPLAPSSPDPRFRFSAVWSNERIVPILDGGLEVLKNDELGQLLLNPYALADLHDVISEVGADAWMPVIQNVGREMMRRESVRLKNVPLNVRLAPVPPATMPFTAKPSKPAAYSRWTGPATVAVLGGVAACLLVAVVGLLWTRLQGGGLANNSNTNLVASATPKFGERKGTVKTLTGLEVTSSLDGHVTLVFFEPKEKQVVLPLSGSAQEWSVVGGGPPTAVVLPDRVEDATAALVIVTETPAAYSIRRLLDTQRYTADQIEEVHSLLQTKLRDLNFKRFAIKLIKLDSR